VITYSSGNHAQGVAYAARRWVRGSDRDAGERAGGEDRSDQGTGSGGCAGGPASSERRAKARNSPRAWLHHHSPYDDAAIIAGRDVRAGDLEQLGVIGRTCRKLQEQMGSGVVVLSRSRAEDC